MKPFRCTVSALAAAAVLLGLVLPLAACGRGDDEASIEENLARTGTLDVLEQAGEDEYEPPADGELTESQVEMYLAVQERAVKIRKVTAERLREQEKEREAKGEKAGFMDAMRSLGDASDFVTAEIRAAKELGHNSAEYQWVQEKVMEAQVARMTAGMREQMGAASEQFVAIMEQQLANTTNAEHKAEIERQIAEYKRGVEENAAGEDLEPGVAHNLELLERYQERIERIQKSYREEAAI
jgi:hypothetical protein